MSTKQLCFLQLWSTAQHNYDIYTDNHLKGRSNKAAVASKWVQTAACQGTAGHSNMVVCAVKSPAAACVQRPSQGVQSPRAE